MKALLLLSTNDAATARELLRSWRSRHQDCRWTVVVRDDDRGPLAAELAGLDVRRDKPAGGKWAFVQALRAERFDLLVVAWHGGERFQPLRLAALFCGARRLVVVDDRGREFAGGLLQSGCWRHGLRRLAGLQAIAIVRGLAAVYRSTLGWLFGGSAVLLAFAWRRLLRRR